MVIDPYVVYFCNWVEDGYCNELEIIPFLLEQSNWDAIEM